MPCPNEPETAASFAASATALVGGWLRRFGLVLALVIIFTALGLAKPNFLTSSNLINVARQISINGILAVGVTAVLLTSGVDLSLGSLVALTGVIAASFAHPQQYPAAVPVLMGVLAGAACGGSLPSIAHRSRLKFCHHGSGQHWALSISLLSSLIPCRPICFSGHTAQSVEVLGSVFRRLMVAPQYPRPRTHRTCRFGNRGHGASSCTVSSCYLSRLRDSTCAHSGVLRSDGLDYGGG